jgi:hypothetical protein
MIELIYSATPAPTHGDGFGHPKCLNLIWAKMGSQRPLPPLDGSLGQVGVAPATGGPL